MFGKICKNCYGWCFIGGIISATIGVKLLKSKACRNLCVNGLASGMRLHRDALETFQNMKEEAADICFDAKTQADAAE